MFRFISLVMLGLGGYWVLQNRFRVINIILGNKFLRRLFVSSLMNLPYVKDQMLKTVFPPKNQYQ